MIRLDEKDRGIIEDFGSKGGDERKHMNPKNLSDGQCWKIVRLSRSPVPREFALDYVPDRLGSRALIYALETVAVRPLEKRRA